MSNDEDHLTPLFVCRCEEITDVEIRAAIAAGARTINDVKRRTRAGMGLCQSIFCASAVADLLQADLGVARETIAPMTARPPVRPISLEMLADME
jgi:bacterioferritin-associated ferredoxin